jgi:predicted nucleic acid-binding protein
VSILVDANVFSEATKPEPDPRVVEWLRRHERAIAVDPIVLGEDCAGSSFSLTFAAAVGRCRSKTA